MASLAHCLPILLLFLQGVYWCYGLNSCPKRYDFFRPGKHDVGYISSPGYPHNYPNNELCTGKFEFYEDYDMVEISFVDFQIEFSDSCDKDYLMLGKEVYCGEELKGKKIQRALPLNFAFVSDGHSTFKGFKANFKYIYGDCPLNKTSDTTGYITSPNYPSDYPQNYACHFKFPNPPTGKNIVELKFSFFDVEYDSACIHDSLKINNVVNHSDTQSNAIKGTTTVKEVKYCGRQLDQQTVTVSTIKLPPNIAFITDSLTQGTGFRATYEYKENECQIYLNPDKSGGYFRSPNYPRSFPTNLQCSYNLPQVNTSYTQIAIMFNLVRIPSYYTKNPSSLEINGHKFSGSQLSYQSVITSAPAKLIFKPNLPKYYYQTRPRQFSATFKYVHACELRVTNETSGFLQSFGYPKTYLLNFCTYKIPIKSGFKPVLTLSFLDFHLQPTSPCLSNYLRINRMKFCGDDLKQKTIDVSLPAYIEFRLNGTGKDSKFNAIYTYKSST